MANDFATKCWLNMKHHHVVKEMSIEDTFWLKELTFNVANKLRQLVPTYLKLKNVSVPAFLYEKPDGSTHATVVLSRLILVTPTLSLTEQTDEIVRALEFYIIEPCIRTCFIHTLIAPCCTTDVRKHMYCRLAVTGETK